MENSEVSAVLSTFQGFDIIFYMFLFFLNVEGFGVRLFVVKNERHAEAFHNGRSLAKEDSLPMGERVKAMEDQRGNFGASKDVKFGPGGSREISFNAGRSSTYKEDRDDEDGDGQRSRRRGVQSLGLKQDVVRGGFRSRGGGGFRGRRGGGRGRGGSRGRGRR